jgi:hypothetical protein
MANVSDTLKSCLILPLSEETAKSETKCENNSTVYSHLFIHAGLQSANQNSQENFTNDVNTATTEPKCDVIPAIANNNAELDEETEQWHIPKEMTKDFLCIKDNYYQPIPLVVYKGDLFVEPPEVNQAIKNALVELHFGILHCKISRPGEGTHNSFNAVPKQLLKSAPIGVPSANKHKNVCSGPGTHFQW